ncbi:hypothetical protein JXA40_05115 [bacterium]|nr:hypothetical protein [candidate division CSSED10-310 bacterium]
MNRKIELALFLMIATMAAAACRNHRKVDLEYHRAPLQENLKSKTLLIGSFENQCKFFDASRDVEATLLKVLTRDNFFSSVDVLEVKQMPMAVDQTVGDFVPFITEFNWASWNEPIDFDLFLIGSVNYYTQDFSGYESQWLENRYGYRVPQKVWKDKLRYEIKIRIVLVDLRAGQVILDREFEDEDVVEGAAEEVGVFLRIAEEKIVEFVGMLRGETVKAERYLLFK